MYGCVCLNLCDSAKHNHRILPSPDLCWKHYQLPSRNQQPALGSTHPVLRKGNWSNHRIGARRSICVFGRSHGASNRLFRLDASGPFCSVFIWCVCFDKHPDLQPNPYKRKHRSSVQQLQRELCSWVRRIGTPPTDPLLLHCYTKRKHSQRKFLLRSWIQKGECSNVIKHPNNRQIQRASSSVWRDVHLSVSAGIKLQQRYSLFAISVQRFHTRLHAELLLDLPKPSKYVPVYCIPHRPIDEWVFQLLRKGTDH